MLRLANLSINYERPRQSSWATGLSKEFWNRKKAVYCNNKYLAAAKKKLPDIQFSFHPLICARGI